MAKRWGQSCAAEWRAPGNHSRAPQTEYKPRIIAKLAGLPSSILNRAKELLATLEAANENKKKLRTKKRQEAMPGEQNLFAVQMQFGRYNEIIDELRALRIEEMSPLDALNRLDALIKEAKKL